MLVALLAARHQRPGAIVAGVAVAALAGSALAAFGGTLIAGLVTLQALTLLVAVALLFAGVAGLIPQKPPKAGLAWGRSAFAGAAVGFFIVEIGDRSQFITAALAARYDSFFLATLGATAGLVAASVPAVLLGPRLAEAVPLRVTRLVVAGLFLLSGLIVAVGALRLT